MYYHDDDDDDDDDDEEEEEVDASGCCAVALGLWNSSPDSIGDASGYLE